MTVKELIERLQKLPPEMPVYVADWSELYADDIELTNASIKEEDPPQQPTAWRDPWNCRKTTLPRRLVLQTDDNMW